MAMLQLIFFTAICRLVVGASHGETCEDEIAREREEDWRDHGEFNDYRDFNYVHFK